MNQKRLVLFAWYYIAESNAKVTFGVLAGTHSLSVPVVDMPVFGCKILASKNWLLSQRFHCRVPFFRVQNPA
jgi:hypothetical protein